MSVFPWFCVYMHQRPAIKSLLTCLTPRPSSKTTISKKRTSQTTDKTYVNEKLNPAL